MTGALAEHRDTWSMSPEKNNHINLHLDISQSGDRTSSGR